ncbi:unnamed protein product [Alopecurus aequalis]
MEADTVRIVSRRMVRPIPLPMPMPPSEEIHLTPWDLYCLSFKYIQTGIVLPKPPAPVVDTLVTSLARALGRYYQFAGRLAVQEHGDGTVTIPLRCTGEGAELVHAVAPSVAVLDVVCSLLCAPSWSAFFPLNGVCGADAAIDPSLPVLRAQVTELADGVFIAMSMNHVVGDGTCFWELFNTWSAINRGEVLTRAPVPVHQRWFVDTSPVPIPLPSGELERVVGRSEIPPPVQHGFFTFSAATVKKLKAKANDEIEMSAATATATATISSLQALVAHLWRAVTRARRLPPREETSCYVAIGCRGRMRGIPPGYVGNALEIGTTTGCTAGEILDAGLGWTAWQLNRAVESFDEEQVRGWLDLWARKPTLETHRGVGTGLMIASSPRFDVFGNDFGWGKPVAMRSSPGESADGIVWAFEGPEQEGSMSLEVSFAPETMERLVADHEFMETVAA